MRPFPFKITYILGLGGVAFPGRDVTFPLDLRIFKRKIGDISNSDRNRYLFLENFLSTTEKLYLSWVNKNLIKDETLEPSSVILQLKRYLETEVVAIADSKIGYTVPTVPLQSFQIPSRYNSNNETTDIFYSFSLADHTHAQIINNTVTKESLMEKLPEIKKYFPVYQGLNAKVKKDKLKYKIKANDLKKYLEFPSYAFMSYQLNVKETQYAEEDQLAKDLEPLNLDILQAYGIEKTIALHYFDQCKAENKIIEFLPFVENLIANLKLRFAKKSTFGEGAFRDYLLIKEDAKVLGNSKYYEIVAKEIISSPQFFPGLFVGVKIDEELKDCKNQSLLLAPIVITHDEFTAELSFEVRNCWLKDETINVVINKKAAEIISGYYKDVIPLMMAFAFSTENCFSNVKKIKIITSDLKTIESNADKNSFKKYFIELIHSFLFANNQIMLPGELAGKMREMIKSDDNINFNPIFKEVLQSQIGSDYGLNVPDYLSLGNYEISLDSKDLYLTRFAYMDYFEGASKHEDT
jgi:hypothetical protein